MAYMRPTLQDIYNRITADMENRVTGAQKIPRFSILGVCAIVWAGAVYLLYGFLGWMARQLFPDTCDDDQVEGHALRYKLPRKAAAYAQGVITFYGSPGTVIPTGTEVQDSNGLIYTTTESAALEPSGAIGINTTAEKAGAEYNSPVYPLTITHPILGVDSAVVFSSLPSGGADMETLSELRSRVLQRMANPPNSGSVTDYVRWAQSIPGVSRAWCLPAELYLGAGSVGVFIAGPNLSAADAGVRQSVIDYLDTVKPVGAIPDVRSIEPVPVDYSIKLNPNTPELQQKTTEALQTLHRSDAEPGGTILISHINAAVSSTGVSDYQIVSITYLGATHGAGNITLSGFQVAAFQLCTFSDI